MNSGKERRGWSGGGGEQMFDVCMWGCDMDKISSVWKHIGGSLGWNSLRPKQAPFFSFDCQARLLDSLLAGLDAAAARQSFICNVVYSNSHTSEPTRPNTAAARLRSVSLLSALVSLLALWVLQGCCHEWETPPALFLPHEHRSLTEPWKSQKGLQLYVFLSRHTVKNMGRTSTPQKEKPACENIKIFTIYCHPNSPVSSKSHNVFGPSEMYMPFEHIHNNVSRVQRWSTRSVSVWPLM